MSYENAPATHMLATNCALCGRPLLDAVSVEIGIGPVCRKNAAYAKADCTEAERQEANRIICALSLGKMDPVAGFFLLRHLGFAGVADQVVKRNAAVTLTEQGDRLIVETPYDDDVIRRMRRIDGRRWDSDNKANTFPLKAKRAIWELLVAHFEGELVSGPKGPFIVHGDFAC